MNSEFVVNGKFNNSACADYMLKKHHACKIDDDLHLYDGAVYRNDLDEITKLIHAAYPPITSGRCKEVYNKIKCRALPAHRADPAIIAFKNGLIDLRQPANERKLMPFTPDIYVTHQLAVDYIDGPYTDTKEYEFLNGVLDDLSCGDEGVKKMLIGMAAYCIYPENPLHHFFVMVGEKQSGKSMMFTLIETMLGCENCSFMNFHDLLSRFGPANLYGKLANLGNELHDATLDANQVAKLKNMTGTYLPIEAERRWKDFFTFTLTAKFIFSCNTIPRMYDPYGGCLDRLILIPMNAHYDENTDAAMREKLRDPKVVSVFSTMCVKALDEMNIATGHAQFPICESAQAKKDEYARNNDSFRLYISSCGLDATAFYDKTVHEAYIEYAKYSHEAGIKEYDERIFKRLLFRMFDVCTVQKRFGTEKRCVIVPKSSVAPKDTEER